jgi:ribosomal protein S18 acetylase RimI-like enzyme
MVIDYKIATTGLPEEVVRQTEWSHILSNATVLRDARPTYAEGMVYSRYLDMLSPGFRRALGRHSVEIVAEAYVQPGHVLSYEHVSFAYRGGAVVGMVSCYTAAQHRHSSSGALRQALGGHGLFGTRAAFLAAFLRRFGPRAEDDFYVWALFVNAEHRGRGIGADLMDLAEVWARDKGLAQLSLDVEAKNHRARRFYKRWGMVVVSEWPALPFIPAATVRMTKML